MRAFIWIFAVIAIMSFSSSIAQRDGRPAIWSQSEFWQLPGPDPSQVAGIIETLNQEAEKQYGKTFIIKYQLDLGPLNRVRVNPELWKNLSARQQRDLGERFATAFRGSGLLFAQFQVGDTTVGKVRSDPIQGGLKYEPAEQP